MLWLPACYAQIMLHHQPLHYINLKFPFFYPVFMNIINISSYSTTWLISSIQKCYLQIICNINYFNLPFKNGAPSIYEFSLCICVYYVACKYNSRVGDDHDYIPYI